MDRFMRKISAHSPSGFKRRSSRESSSSPSASPGSASMSFGYNSSRFYDPTPETQEGIEERLNFHYAQLNTLEPRAARLTEEVERDDIILQRLRLSEAWNWESTLIRERIRGANGYRNVCSNNIEWHKSEAKRFKDLLVKKIVENATIGSSAEAQGISDRINREWGYRMGTIMEESSSLGLHVVRSDSDAEEKPDPVAGEKGKEVSQVNVEEPMTIETKAVVEEKGKAPRDDRLDRPSLRKTLRPGKEAHEEVSELASVEAFAYGGLPQVESTHKQLAKGKFKAVDEEGIRGSSQATTLVKRRPLTQLDRVKEVPENRKM
ncbi:MAG: hypothetical protein M1837_000618 [Sclerophora amabilis]|nr:MAG: hypothetical protein M1837_000618 [Sclerophora amabilis]